jgi:hypothetical protein
MAEKRRRQPRIVSGAANRRNRTYGRKWREVRLRVLARDEHRCQIRSPRCRGTATMVDHVTPAKETGPVYDPMLLRACCRPCNNFVAAHPEWRPGQPFPNEKPSVQVGASGFPPRWELPGNCPHHFPNGEWCPGTGGHWSRWWVGSAENPPSDATWL